MTTLKLHASNRLETLADSLASLSFAVLKPNHPRSASTSGRANNQVPMSSV